MGVLGGVAEDWSVRMVVLFRLAYALAVAIFFILLVIFGQRTMFSEPDYPVSLTPPRTGIYCDDHDCYNNGVPLDEEDDDTLISSDQEFVRRYRAFHDDRLDYFRGVFVVSALLAIAAIGAGIYLFRRVEALPLGLVLGGIGVAAYGWVESSRGDGEAIAMYAFIISAIGFVVLAAGGYWFLGGREPRSSEAAEASGG